MLYYQQLEMLYFTFTNILRYYFSYKTCANPYVGGVIGAALLDPNFTALIGAKGGANFLGCQ